MFQKGVADEMSDETKLIRSRWPFLVVHQKYSYSQELHALQKLEGKGGFDCESQAEAAHMAVGNGSDPIWVGAGGSVPLECRWKAQDTIPLPLMIFSRR